MLKTMDLCIKMTIQMQMARATVVLDYAAAARNESAYFQCPTGRFNCFLPLFVH